MPLIMPGPDSHHNLPDSVSSSFLAFGKNIAIFLKIDLIVLLPYVKTFENFLQPTE